MYRLVGGEKLAWHGRYHAHGKGEFEFHFFLEGQGSFLINRTRYALDSGTLLLARPHEFHSILPEALARPLSYYAVLFQAELDRTEDNEALRLLASDGVGARGLKRLEKRDRFLFEELHRLFFISDQDGRLAASYQLLSLIYRWYGRRQDDRSMVVEGNPHVEKSLRLMERSVREKLVVEDLANAVGVSAEHLIRIFHRQLGISPLQYFARLKAEAASALLVDSALSVGAVAELFGYENQFHFSKVFKKCTGLAPQAYRRVYAEARVIKEAQ